MIIESRRYLLYPGKLQEYLACFASQPGVLDLLRPRLRGFWFSEGGVLNAVHHLWAYESRAERASVRASLAVAPGMAEFIARVTPMLQRQQSDILTGDLQDAEATAAAGVFDFVSVSLHPRADTEALAPSLGHFKGGGFRVVSALRRRAFEVAGPVRELQFVLRSDSLAERDDNWRAVDEVVSPLLASPQVASLDCQLMLPSAFSPWR